MSTFLTDPFWLVALAAGMAATGLVAGLLAGLLGVGGGVVIVPVLFTILPFYGVSEAVLMKLAIGTSLATIIPTSIVSVRRHHAKGALDWGLLRSLGPSILVGAVAGTLLGLVFGGPMLALVFGAIGLVVAAQLGFTGVDSRLRDSLPGGVARAGIGAWIGGASALMGIGGGTIGVPVLTMFGVPIRTAVGTASAFGLVIAVPGTLGFILGGLNTPALPPFSLGYVNLVGLALIVPTSVLATPWGVHLAHSIPPLLLKRCFAVFLGVTGGRMVWQVLERWLG
jgi:uncharacterized membrane protein YfcA